MTSTRGVVYRLAHSWEFWMGFVWGCVFMACVVALVEVLL